MGRAGRNEVLSEAGDPGGGTVFGRWLNPTSTQGGYYVPPIFSNLPMAPERMGTGHRVRASKCWDMQPLMKGWFILCAVYFFVYVFAAVGTFSLTTLTLILKTILCTLVPIMLSYAINFFKSILSRFILFTHFCSLLQSCLNKQSKQVQRHFFCSSDLKIVF